jgi:hypothetical protein
MALRLTTQRTRRTLLRRDIIIKSNIINNVCVPVSELDQTALLASYCTLSPVPAEWDAGSTTEQSGCVDEVTRNLPWQESKLVHAKYFLIFWVRGITIIIIIIGIKR